MVLLKKKQEQIIDPEFQKLVEKWDGFLLKIESRFQESLIDAEQALLENLISSNYDFITTIKAWQGIKSQIRGLGDKLHTSYKEKVEIQMLNYREKNKLTEQRKKGTKLREAFLKKIEHFEIIIEGKISINYYNHAKLLLHERHQCTQCGALLTINKNVFNSQYVSCNYCNTVNTFIPNDKIYQIKLAIDKITKYKAIKEKDALNKALKKLFKLPPFSDGDKIFKYKVLLNQQESAERAYWQKYFSERYRLLPEAKDSFDHDVDVKMNGFYKNRKRKYNY